MRHAGCVALERGGVVDGSDGQRPDELSVVSFTVDDGVITEINLVRNPDKLATVPPLA